MSKPDPKAHSQALDAIGKALVAAENLAKSGARITNTLRNLKEAQREIKTRIEYFTAEEKKSRPAAPAQQALQTPPPTGQVPTAPKTPDAPQK